MTGQPTAAEAIVRDALYAAEPDMRRDSAVAFMAASDRARVAVSALAAAGLLVTPEHDAHVRSEAYREWFMPDPIAARGYWQVPCDDCSGTGVFPVPEGFDGDSSCVRCKGTGWSLVSMVDPGADAALAEHDAQVAARALREAAESMRPAPPVEPTHDDAITIAYLHDRADRIERGEAT